MSVTGRARTPQRIRRTKTARPGPGQLELPLDTVRTDPPKRPRARRAPAAPHPELDLGPLLRRPRIEQGPPPREFTAVRLDGPATGAGADGRDDGPETGAEQALAECIALLAAELGAQVVATVVTAVPPAGLHDGPADDPGDAEARADLEEQLAADRSAALAAELLGNEHRLLHGGPPPGDDDGDGSYWGSDPEGCGCAASSRSAGLLDGLSVGAVADMAGWSGKTGAPAELPGHRWPVPPVGRGR